MSSVHAIATEERRREAREQIYLDGEILFDDGRAGLDCLVPNWSAIGAEVHVIGAGTVPDEFTLNVKRLGWHARARVVRREAGILGVRFVPTGG